MRRTATLVAALVLVTAGGCAPSGSVDRIAIAKALECSLVRAEYTLRFDKGQPPESYSQYHQAEIVVRQERPLEIPGFLVDDTTVVIPDPIIHPRFVKDVAVRFGDQLVKASLSGYAKDETAAFLTLAEPLTEAKPLEFDPKAGGPLFTAQYFRRNAAWTVQVASLSATAARTERGREYTAVGLACLIVDRAGRPVGTSMNGYLPTGDSWKGSPLKWPRASSKEMAKLLADVEDKADKALLRVKLSFRSPKKGSSGGFRMGPDGDGSATELNVIGILTKGSEVLVLAQLKPNVTARLEQVTVHPAKGKPVPAKFAHTLKDYGCFLARLDRPLGGAVKLSERDVLDFEDRLLPSADMILHGEKREVHFSHKRIGQYQIGWKRHVHPSIRGRSHNIFLFDPDGALLSFPVARREKVSVEGRWGGGRPNLTAAGDLRQVLAELAANVDPSNVPLTEAQENRLAWMGVELQGLNKELARVNKVSHLTNDGQSGALVSYVYPDSPASKAGVEPGYVLIRLDVEGHPKPLDVQIRDYGLAGRSFPWDRLDEVPEQYFERIPCPWPPAENPFTRALTDLGFGKKYTALFFSDGKTISKKFSVVESPPHYNSTRRHKDADLGITVRDLTYEVRRYFQKKPTEPGVIVSKLEPGSKASVSGIKPYEIITHVNDKPVMKVADFEKLIKGQQELRLSVKRMTRGRLVKIKMAPGGKKPTTTTAPKPPAKAPGK